MSRHIPVSITKMSGAGNTFSLIDARVGSAWKEFELKLGMSRRTFAKMVCDRVLGVGTDGLLFIESGTGGADFTWDFYNSDGSSAEMCGNAARCAARFCHENLNVAVSSKIRFQTGAGLIVAEILEQGKIRVTMPEARILNKQMELRTKSSATEKFAYVNTGVPHLVQKIHNIADSAALKDMAKEVRAHPDLLPAGANVTFYAETSLGKINAVTFERGVEDYTLACGTGAVAAALIYSQERALTKVQVQMPGGMIQVHFASGDPHPLLIGDAVFVGDFKYNFEVVK